MRSIIKILFGRGKMDIIRKLLRLIFLGSFLIFLIVGIIAITGIVTTWLELETSGEKIGKVTAEYVENYSKDNIKQHLQELVKNRATLISFCLEESMLEVQMMSNEMTKILQNPQNYVPRKLTIANYEKVHSGEAYLHYNQELIKSGVTDEIQQEIDLASNFEDILVALGKYYHSVMVGSKNGYVVKLDNLPNKNELLPICLEPVKTNYNVKEREWYKLGQKVTEPKFTNAYTAQLTGFNCVTCVMPYYDNSGFAGVVGIDINLEEIYEHLNATVIGETMYWFILNDSGKVIFSSEMEQNAEFEEQANIGIPEIMEKLRNGESGVESVRIGEDEKHLEEYYLAYEPIKNWGLEFGAILKTSEVIEPAQIAKDRIISQFDKSQYNLSVVFIIIAIISASVVVLLLKVMIKISVKASKKFVKPIYELIKGVRDISSGNFDKKIEIKTGDEIEHLAVSFNAMTDELKSYMENVTKVTAENEKVAAELDIAKEIQTSMLQKKFENRKEYEIYTTMKTSKDVEGGFCDFYQVDENHLLFMITDVSVKGVPAALYMLIVKTILHNVSLTIGGVSLEEMVHLANRQLCENNEATMFATMFIGMLDLKNGNLSYINAGHKLPLIYRRSDEKFVYLQNVKKNFVIGINDEAKFTQKELKMNVNDIIFLYTDSLIEVTNESDEIFNQKRLEECLNSEDIKNCTLKEILQIVKKNIENYVGDKKTADDFTMTDIIYRGKKDD